MISLKQLHYALTVRETLHFKNAAEICNVSQSALSTAINELEKRLGLKVFERDNKKVLVTPIGEQVLSQARQIMLQVDDLQHFAEMQMSPFSYPISIGLIPTIAPYLLPKLLPSLKRSYPKAELNIIESQSHVLAEKVRHGELDAAILALPYPCDGLIVMNFWEEDFYWASLKEHKLAGQKEITREELEEVNLLLLEEGHCLKDHILEVCKLSINSSTQNYNATSLNTIIQMVLGHMGTTLIPAMAKEQLTSQHDEISVSHLNVPSPHRRLAFVVRPNFTRMASIEALIEICKNTLSIH